LPVVVAAALVAACAVSPAAEARKAEARADRAGLLVSILERIIGCDRLARGILPGGADRLTFANTGRGRFAYLAVYPPKGVHEATYALRVGRDG
jgi:hypothetical protein